MSFDTSGQTQGYKSCQKAQCQTLRDCFSTLVTTCNANALVSPALVTSLSHFYLGSKFNIYGIGSKHDLIHLGSCEIILASFSRTLGPFFPSPHLSSCFSPPFPTTHYVFYNGQMCETSNMKSKSPSICSEGHCFVSFETKPFFSSFLSPIFITSFSSVPSSPDANY